MKKSNIANSQKLKVGDIVCSTLPYDDMGHGRIVSISKNHSIPIIVVLSYNGEEYTYYNFDSLEIKD